MKNRVINSHASRIHTHITAQLNTVQHSMINSSHTNILFQRKLATQSDCRVCVCDSFLLGGTSTEWNFQITTHTLTQRHFASLQRFMKMRSNPLSGLKWSICFACTVFLWTCHSFVSFCDHYYVLVYRFSLAIAVWLNVAHTHTHTQNLFFAMFYRPVWTVGIQREKTC